MFSSVSPVKRVGFSTPFAKNFYSALTLKGFKMNADPTDINPGDAIDDLISGPAQNLGEQREMGFRMIKQRMADTYATKLKSGRSPTLVRQSMLTAYGEALEDAFRVFTQIVEGSGMDSDEIMG